MRGGSTNDGEAQIEKVEVNFLGLGDAGVRDAYDAAPYSRLVDLKRRWDPTNAFHLNQNIAPAAAVNE